MERPFPAYKGDDPYIFVSYAHEDTALVFAEIKLLKDQGFNIWYDEGISPGSTWREELAAAITNCDLFMLFVTPSSATSNNCLKEVNYALEEDRPMLAVHLESTDLSQGLRLSLSDRQAILKHELTDQEYREKVMAGVRSHVQQGQSVGAIAPVPVASNSTKPILIGAAFIAVAILAVGILIYMRLGGDSDSTPALIVEQAPVVTPAEPAIAVRIPSIAVLPFVNMSNDPEQEFFSDGLSEDILNGLVKFSDIKVVARTSSFQFKGSNQDVRKIGELLDVAHVLEGSVRKVGSRIRVTAQLVSTSDGSHLWSEQYNRELTDVFEVQDEITAAILDALNVHLGPVSPVGVTVAPTTNTEAYNAFLTGRYHRNRLEYDKAVEDFELAVALDPEYADAYAQLGVVHSLYVWWVQAPAREKFPIVNAYMDKALALDPGHRVGLTGRAMNRFYVERDYQTAIDELHRLLERYPNETDQMGAYGAVLQTIGRLDVAVELQRRRVALDPLSPIAHRQLTQALHYAGRFDEAKSSAIQTERLGLDVALLLYSIAVATGDRDGVQEQLDRDLSAWGRAGAFREIERANVARIEGDHVKVNELVAQIKETPVYQLPIGRMAVSFLEGDMDTALDYFDELLEAAEPVMMRDARGRPANRKLFPEFYSHPRYLEILKKAGLDHESVARLVVPALP